MVNFAKFNSATYCHVCEKSFAPDDKQIRDNCHLTEVPPIQIAT